MTGSGPTTVGHPTLVAGPADRPALVDAAGGRRWTYGELRGEIDRLGTVLAPAVGHLTMVAARNDVGAVVAAVAGLEHGAAVMLVDPSLPADAWAALVARYRPARLVGSFVAADGYRAIGDDAVVGPVAAPDAEPAAAHPDLGLLLATSGSTGSPKYVRLSRSAVAHNARAIAAALALDADEVAPTNLPIHYSYGFSILSSHLAAGATVVVTDASVLSRQLWTTVDEHRCTSLAGVPYTYQALARIGFDPARHPSVRTLTQAGGRLGEAQARPHWEAMDRIGGRFVVMYGQTEATARMAVLPHEAFGARPGSVGRAVPGGAFSTAPADGPNSDGPGEVIYRGPNVMMGYATGGADLAAGDHLGGVLPTGDLGRLDADGFLYLAGRASRFAKVLGVRVSLDDVEDLVRRDAQAAAVGAGDRLVVFAELDAARAGAVRRALAERLRVHPSAVDVRPVPALPLLPNGKVDYRTLEADA